MTTKYPTPEVATLHGRLQTAERRAEQAEAEAKKLTAALRTYIKWCHLLMSELVANGIQAPAKPKDVE